MLSVAQSGKQKKRSSIIFARNKSISGSYLETFSADSSTWENNGKINRDVRHLTHNAWKPEMAIKLLSSHSGEVHKKKQSKESGRKKLHHFLSFGYWWVCLWYFESVKELIRMCQKDEGCFCAGLKTLRDILMNFLEQKWNKILFFSRMMFNGCELNEKPFRKDTIKARKKSIKKLPSNSPRKRSN